MSRFDKAVDSLCHLGAMVDEVEKMLLAQESLTEEECAKNINLAEEHRASILYF